jgi:hypothetical protein
MRLLVLAIFILFIHNSTIAQCDRWKMEVCYDMDIDFEVKNHSYTGSLKIVLKNNSPDTLIELFFHLYNNAFRPGSEMDFYNRVIPDPDSRISDRIMLLNEHEMGRMEVTEVKIKNHICQLEEFGTILKVTLGQAITPGKKVTIMVKFNAQVPLQIRRNGRMSSEGVHYSMAQWYPKLCQYDQEGWHVNPYIGREFYGIFGQFNVNIKIDSTYMLAGTGNLLNAREIGKGYTTKRKNNPASPSGKYLWKFEAKNVHDFMWAADPEYVHVTDTTRDGIVLRAFYKPAAETNENWPKLLPVMKAAFNFIQPKYGKYPYNTYAFIQGGDGGMEYPMATLITGHRNLGSLVGVSVHELMHSWYHGVLGFNESKYHWMDEGFTTYASQLVMHHLTKNKFIPGTSDPANLFKNSYTGYINLVSSGLEEPMGTHADHFLYNTSYGLAAYSKGSLYLYQLSGIIGEDKLDQTLITLYNKCKYHHPTDRDFIALAERISGMKLKWYNEYWVYSTKTIDYTISSTSTNEQGELTIDLQRLGTMPMPIEVLISLKNGQNKRIIIPLSLMYNSKPINSEDPKVEVAEYWDSVNPYYVLNTSLSVDEVLQIQIDPDNLIMDIDRSNNLIILQK